MTSHIVCFIVISGFAVSAFGDVVLSDQVLDWWDMTRSEYRVNNQVFSNSPSWDGKKDPPLKVSDAVEKAAVWLRRTYRWLTVGDVSLIRVSRHDYDGWADKWFYTVAFHVRRTADSSDDDRVRVAAVVLMDGSIVEPAIKGKLQGH